MNTANHAPLLIAALCAYMAAGCAHTGSAPDPEEAHPANSLDDASKRAMNALMRCSDQYVDQNVAAAATASEIADAAVSHCGPEFQTVDAVTREQIAEIIRSARARYPGTNPISRAEFEQQAALMHGDAVRAVRGAALERVIRLRNPQAH